MNEELEHARTTRDYSSFRLWELPWDEFRTGEFIPRVANINQFDFNAWLSGLGRWQDLVDSNRVALQLYGAIEDSLVEAGFFGVPRLETAIEPERITFRYDEPDFAFDLYFQGNGRVHLRRMGSSMRAFHYWYTHFMPSIPGILNKAIAILDQELERALRDQSVGEILRGTPRPSDGVEERVRVLNASYNFHVTCYQLRRAGASVRNLNVMKQNVAIRMPDSRGRLVQDSIAPDDFDNYGRMDYTVSTRHQTERSITQFMQVNAPSNSGWSGLFFEFSYVGENYAMTPTGAREAPDPELFLSSARCSDAYISFFRDIALDGFMSSVMSGFDFDTTAGGLA
jgi:hypothetical protein